MKPLCIDLFCGLGGWTEGFLAEGYTCIGFDIERHEYGDFTAPVTPADVPHVVAKFEGCHGRGSLA